MSPTPRYSGAFELVTTRLSSSVGRVRPEERRDALGAFLTLFGFMAGHALLETARDALFLASVPASQLPWVYLTIAVVALVLTQRQPRILHRLSTRHELSGWLVLAAAITFGFWLLVGWVGPWVFYALYTWSGVLATLVVVRFWTVLGNLFTVTQAKRVFTVIGSGSVMGAIVGSGVARVLTELLAANYVVLAAALVFLVSSAGPRLLGGAETGIPAASDRAGAWDVAQVGRVIWARPYLRRVATLILLATVTFTLVDFVFKMTAARVVAPEQMGEFFSSVYLTLNVLSLIVQVVVVAWLLRRLGVNLAVAAVPALLLAGALGFVAVGSLTLALLLKGVDGSLRHSLYRTGTELLFVPMSAELRARVKAFIDVLGQRGGQALASLLILVLLAATTREVVFAGLASVTAAFWLFFALDLRKHYLNVFRETLNEEITETRIEFPALDLASLETLLATLNAPDDRRVMAALDMLATQGKVRVIPALILYHPSPPVVVHALDLFIRSGRSDVLPIVDRLLAHPDPRVRTASLRVHSVLNPQEPWLRQALSDPAPEVRATALVGLIAGDWLSRAEADGALQVLVADGSAEARLALARAIGYQPAAVFERALLALAGAGEAETRLEAVRAMREVRGPAFIPTLIGMLGERALRDEARSTLVALGPTALSRLTASLKDTELPHGIRRHLPLAIATFGTVAAADALVKHLLHETDGMIRYKILRALGRLRNEQPALPLDTGLLNQASQQTLSVAFRFMRWRRALERGAAVHPIRQTEIHEVLVMLLRDKENHALERIFRLLNLQANNDDFRHIYRGLNSPRRESRASSRELLEHLVFPPMREPLLRLIDDLYESRGAAVRPGADEEDLEAYEAVLAELVGSTTESLSSLAAYHVAELNLASLEPLLRRRLPLSDDHAEVLAYATGTLATPAAPRVSDG